MNFLSIDTNTKVILKKLILDLQSCNMYSRFGEKTNNLQECLPPRQTRPKRNASGFEKDLVPGTDWMSVKAQKRNLDSEKEVHGRGSNLPRFIKW